MLVCVCVHFSVVTCVCVHFSARAQFRRAHDQTSPEGVGVAGSGAGETGHQQERREREERYTNAHRLKESQQTFTCWKLFSETLVHINLTAADSWRGLLLRGSACCAFRDALLHSLLVTSGFLSRLIFLLRCQQDIFSLWIVFPWIFSFTSFSLNCRDVSVGKTSKSLK